MSNRQSLSWRWLAAGLATATATATAAYLISTTVSEQKPADIKRNNAQRASRVFSDLSQQLTSSEPQSFSENDIPSSIYIYSSMLQETLKSKDDRQLPPPILVHILSFLTLKELTYVSSVNRQFAYASLVLSLSPIHMERLALVPNGAGFGFQDDYHNQEEPRNGTVSPIDIEADGGIVQYGTSWSDMDTVRGRCWCVLTGCDRGLKVKWSILSKSKQCLGSECDAADRIRISDDVVEAIEKDIPRTLLHRQCRCAFVKPTLTASNSNTSTQILCTCEAASDANLNQLLIRYAGIDPGVSYCQAMNFVAGSVITHVSSKSALPLFTAILRSHVAIGGGKRSWADIGSLLFQPGSHALAHSLVLQLLGDKNHMKSLGPSARLTSLVANDRELRQSRSLGLRLMFLPNLAGMMIQRYQFSELLRCMLPALFNHLREARFPLDLLIVESLMTCWSAPAQFPLSIGRLWDIFLSQGQRAVFAVGLAVLSLCEDQICHMEFEDIHVFFKQTQPYYLKHPEELLNVASQFEISNMLLKQLYVEAVTHVQKYGSILPHWDFE